MKKSYLFLITLCLLVTLFSCANERDKGKSSPEADIKWEDAKTFCNGTVTLSEDCDLDEISLAVSDVEYTPEEELILTAFWHNSSAYAMTYGLGYKVYRVTDGEKTELESDRVWDHLAYVISPQSVIPAEENYPMVFNLLANYDIQPDQVYRIEAPFTYEDEQHTATVEFYIKK